MAGTTKKDPLSEFNKAEFDIPNIPVDIPLVLAEKQARRVGGRFIKLDSDKKRLLDYFEKFINENRLQEQFIRILELTSMRGQVIVVLDRGEDRETPVLTVADPQLMSRVEKLLVEEKSAVVWKYLGIDSKMHPVKEIGTPTKVRRLYYHGVDTVTTDEGTITKLEELEKIDPLYEKEKEHGFGCLPVVELRNKQTGVPPWIDHGSGKPWLATWGPVQGLIKHFYHLQRQQWKNIVLTKPKIVGTLRQHDRKEFERNGGDSQPFANDLFVNVDTVPGDPIKGRGSGIEIFQGDPRLTEFMACSKEMLGLIYLAVGLPPMDDKGADTYKNTTDVYANQQHSIESLSLMKQITVDQGTRIFEKVAIMGGFGDGKGRRPFTLSIPQEENLNKLAEIEESLTKINANLSNYIFEIARIYNVTEEEAEEIYDRNLKVNKKSLEVDNQKELLDSEEKGKKDD